MMCIDCWEISGGFSLAARDEYISTLLGAAAAGGLVAASSGDQPSPHVRQARHEEQQLSQAEKEAIANHDAGRAYDQAAYRRARLKQIHNEKVARERNKQKRQKGKP